MKIAFVVNDVATEQDNYTTVRLARRACGRGHEVWFIGLSEFICEESGAMDAYAISPRARDYKDDAELLQDIQAKDASPKRIRLDEMDVMLLRSDPAVEANTRPWAPPSSLMFAQLAALHGVLVLSDPVHLLDAQNKTYLHQFPEQVRPASCITRCGNVIERFIESHGGEAVIKPLQGSGGQNVFLIKGEGRSNLQQMIDAVTRDGYALVQEYLPKAAEGDLRLLLLNGRPLWVDGHYACFQRYNDQGNMRSNISAGGKYELAEPDEAALRLAELVGPKLVKDGMYFVGLDIVGDKLLEINVDTPGGINMAEELTDVDFSGYIIDDLERKARLNASYRGQLGNESLAVM